MKYAQSEKRFPDIVQSLSACLRLEKPLNFHNAQGHAPWVGHLLRYMSHIWKNVMLLHSNACSFLKFVVPNIWRGNHHPYDLKAKVQSFIPLENERVIKIQAHTFFWWLNFRGSCIYLFRILPCVALLQFATGYLPPAQTNISIRVNCILYSKVILSLVITL